MHQLRLQTNISIRHLPHSAEEPIFFNPFRPIHPIGDLHRERNNIPVIT